MTDHPAQAHAGTDTVARAAVPAPGDGRAYAPPAPRAPEPGTAAPDGSAAGTAAGETAPGTAQAAPEGRLWQALTAMYVSDTASDTVSRTPRTGTGAGTATGDTDDDGHPRDGRTAAPPDGRLRRALSALYTAGPASADVPAAVLGAEGTRGAGEPGEAATAPFTAAVVQDLLCRAERDRRLTREAGAAPTPQRRRGVAECHRDNADALAGIVGRHGWPAAAAVGAEASTAALMILLHAPRLDLRLRCRDLIAQATADGRTPAVHLAYIADHCAVELGEPQFYGTRINPVTLRPYPVRLPRTLDERRQDVGLGPMEEQMRALRLRG
ncbi:DUF6624 domain-containing protein [Streptomyces sp. PsTaAH-124]|uniref:DUF6624 domain-containing protein n=1 Tax=Streptomyces sp. PsTaAH-124 TaxID=1157638 RepID=UPI00037C3306|nr:DUF6624 domain-containing protein [Streptomyces sp. PsTaAH-124]